MGTPEHLGLFNDRSIEVRVPFAIELGKRIVVAARRVVTAEGPAVAGGSAYGLGPQYSPPARLPP
jgi:hypothetical protein